MAASDIAPDPEYLTTRELAELLRIKERKVYDLAASGDVPCSRATGKLLFPRRAIEAWIARHSSGPEGELLQPRPGVFLGSHDPLLEWALRDSRCGLATYFDGSLDGLERFARREGVATGLHVYEPESDGWNLSLARSRFAAQPVVLVELAWRERGLIVGPGSEARIRGIADLEGLRMVSRQAEAGSQVLLEHLLRQAGFDESCCRSTALVRTETDAALVVLEGRADAAFGLMGLARQHRLGFVPLVRERFDLLVDRRDWFEPPMQRFLAFCRSAAFIERARDLHGYDVSGFGTVHFNGE